MNKKPVNMVFFPHSVNFGLAGTNRLQNIIYFLKKENITSISNIALEDRSKLFEKKDIELFLEDYQEIYYGPSIVTFIGHIFKTLNALTKRKKAGHKNVMFFYGEIDIKNFFFVLWAKLIGFKILIDVVEDLETIVEFKSFKNKLKYRSAIFFRKRLNLFADRFTVVSTFLQRKMTGYFPQTPIFFLPVTINTYLLSDQSQQKEDKMITIFYSGSFNFKDGLSYLLEALFKVKSKGKEFCFLLSGKGSEEEMKRFWKTVDLYDLHGSIDYLGFLNRKQYVDALTRKADVLCMTRINSAFANAGFPFKLGEFLATGKPVIASTVGNVTDYISENDAYLVKPESAEEIYRAIIAIIDNKESARNVGLNGKAAALKYFDHEKYAAPLKEFIEGI